MIAVLISCLSDVVGLNARSVPDSAEPDAPSLASWSALSLQKWPLWAGIHTRVTDLARVASRLSSFTAHRTVLLVAKGALKV